MSSMRAASSIICTVLLAAVPILAMAAPSAPDKPCLLGTIQTKSFSWASLGKEGIKSGLKSQSQTLVSRNDKCSDEKVSIAGGLTTTITLCVTRTCKRDDTTYGCAKGQKPPQLLFGSKDGYIAINKCHKNADILSAIASTIESESPDALVALSERAPALLASLSRPPTPVNLSTPDGRAQVVQELAAGAGISEAEAKAIVEKDPLAAIKAVNAISTAKSDEEVRAAVKAIGLNPDLADHSTQAAMQALVAKNNDLSDPNSADELEASLDTFRRDAETVRQNVLEALSPLCAQLGGCSDTGCVSNPNSLTCRTNNPGALTWSSWQANYGGAPCGERNNTTCFPSVEQGLAAKIGLLTSPRYFGGDNNTILSMLCNGYASNSAVNNCSSYATFVQNQTGIPMNQTVDPRNPEQIGKIAMAISRMENGRSVPFTPAQLQGAMALVYGGTLPNGTPGYVPERRVGTNAGTEFGSPFNVNPYSGAAPASVGYGSPFAQTTPAPVSSPTYSPTSAAIPQTTAPTPRSPTQSPTPDGQQNVAQQLLDALDLPLSATSSPAIIITDPKDLRRGGQIVVSWATFGMSTQKPCVVRTRDGVIAEGNRGSKTIPTTQSTPMGSIVFTLSCTSLFGAPVQRTAATFVR